MPRGLVVYRFGPFELDPASGRLFCGDTLVPLSWTQSVILMRLISDAPAVVSKDDLIREAWGGASVSANSLDKAISALRKTLGTRGGSAVYIETLPLRGYRFVAHVVRAERATPEASLEAHLAPFRALLLGRTALDTMDLKCIREARAALEPFTREHPNYADGFVYLAMACGLTYEATTIDVAPDEATLISGVGYAQRGCELAPGSGEAWSTLAFLRRLTGDHERAAAAACKAMMLEPDDFRHALRMAYVSWGEARLRAAQTALRLSPGRALAHWLRATVFIARRAFERALEEIRLGCAAQARQTQEWGFRAVGLHLLHGLVLAELGHVDEAIAAFECELASADSGQIYARECAANTWYALGAVRRRQRRHRDAEEAFRRALAVAPVHAPATAALHGEIPPTRTPIDHAIARAIVLARGGRHAEAAAVYREAVAAAPPGAGWILPVEPTLNPSARPEIWDDVVALVGVRAT